MHPEMANAVQSPTQRGFTSSAPQHAAGQRVEKGDSVFTDLSKTSNFSLLSLFVTYWHSPTPLADSCEMQRDGQGRTIRMALRRLAHPECPKAASESLTAAATPPGQSLRAVELTDSVGNGDG